MTFTKDFNGETDLMKAADVGDLDFILEALPKDSSSEYVNAQNHYGNTALMLAANHNYVLVVEELLAAGADVTIENSVGQTAVLMADRQDFTDMVKLLVANGAVQPPPKPPVVQEPPPADPGTADDTTQV